MNNNKKGFTLIELLAVIVLLAIILVTATITVNSTIKKSRTKAFDNTMLSIVETAKNILSKNNDISVTDFKNTIKSNLKITDNEYKIDTAEITDSEGKVTGYRIVLEPGDGNKFKNINLSSLGNEKNTKFIYQGSNKVCVFMNKNGNVVTEDSNGTVITNCVHPPTLASNTETKPGMGTGDTTDVTKVTSQTVPSVVVPSTKNIEVGSSGFYCCPANDTQGKFDYDFYLPPYYETHNGVKYCKKEFSEADKDGYISEGRTNFTGLGKFEEWLNGKDSNTYATMMCTPKYDENNDTAFSIKEILKGLNHGDVTTVGECIAKGYCIQANEIKRDQKKKISLGSNVYGIVGNLKYKSGTDICTDRIVNYCKSFSEIENMIDSYIILLFDKNGIIKEGNEDYIKEIYFAFMVSDNEWKNRYIKATTHFAENFKYRSDVTIFNYKEKKYTVTIGKSTEMSVGFWSYGLGTGK